TVDRFQGHEADFVMLSFANNHPTSFLESPNRLNVAITRAKHQLIVYGNRPAMQKAPGVLGTFASNSYWSTTIETESQEAL
ncbi:AAA domain-containing protein, partial [Vibrio owensii]